MTPPRQSAGLLLYRPGGPAGAAPEVFLAHMGGPLWATKDAGAWSIPKGELEPGEEPIDAALREFGEEIGVPAPSDLEIADLGGFRYRSGKIVHVFAAEAVGFEVGDISGGTFEMEWPPRSGRMRRFPEVDRAEWMAPAAARDRLVAGQRPAVDALLAQLAAR